VSGDNHARLHFHLQHRLYSSSVHVAVTGCAIDIASGVAAVPEYEIGQVIHGCVNDLLLRHGGQMPDVGLSGGAVARHANRSVEVRRWRLRSYDNPCNLS
jgi:hypothetical protein